MSILSVKTSDFLYKYSPIVELSDLAPIPIQELSIRLGYGLSRNKNLFNLVLDILDVPGGSPLRNAMFISGVPGAGKTNAILKILYEMLHKDNDRISTITCGPGKQQVDNLTASLNPSNNNPMTKEQLFLWLGLDLNDVNNESSGKIKDGKLILGNQGAYSDTDVPDVIFIDEATHFTNLELLRIAEYCDEKGTILILAGDPDQTGKRNFITVADEQGQGHMVNNAFLTVICVCTPKSTVSMRDSNSNKRDNNELTKALATEWNLGTIQQDAAVTGKSADEYLLDLLDKIILKGTEHTSGIYGDLVVDSVSEEQVIKLIENLNQGEKVGYIYSDINSPTYALMERLKQNSQYAGQIEIKSALEFFDEGSAQGSENLFFIVDIDWDAKAANLNPGGMEPLDYVEYLNFVKSIYTTTTRSKQGSYILDRGFTAIFGNNVSKVVPIDAVSKVSMNDLSLTNHKQRRLDRIRSIIQGHTPNGAAYPDLNSNSPLNNPLGNGSLQQGGTQPLGNPAQGGQTNSLNVSDTAPAKQVIAVNRVDAANFDPSTINFTDNVVGVYLMPTDKVDDVELNGYVKIKKTSPLWYTVATAQEIQSRIDNLPDDLALFVITFPKSATNETLAGTIAPPGSFIGNNHVAAVITNNLPSTTQGGNPPQGNPPSGGLTTGGQSGNGGQTGGGVNPVNLNKFKVGYIKQYNSKLCKIINVNDPNITVEYVDGSLETLNLQNFAANASNGTKKAWDDAVQTANLPTQPNTKFKVGDLLAINQDDGTPLKNAIYKVVGIVHENNSWKYVLKNEKTGFTTKPKIETVDGNEIKYVTILESTPKQRKPLSVTISDEALANVIKHADNGPGIMLYTSFGIREGVEFERDADGNLLSNGTSYTIKRVGETGNPNNAMQDMQALLGITASTTISVSDYNAAKRYLYQVQSALKFGKLNARLPIHKQVEGLINEFRLTRNISKLKLNKGRFLIKLLPENSNTVFDRGVNYFPDSPKIEAKQNKCLIYTVEDTNGNLYEFYIGTIATESTNQTFILSIRQALTEQVNAGQMSLQDANKVISAWETAGTTIRKVNDIVKLNGSLVPITYIPLADDFEPSSLLITNSKLVGISIEGDKTSGDARHSMLLDNFRNNLSRIVSPPQIITNKNIAKAGLDSSMAGKPVVLVTHDLLLKYRPTSLSPQKLITDPQQLADLWDIAWSTDIPDTGGTEYLQYLRDVRLKIKVVTLNSVGYTFKEVMESLFAFRNSLDQRGTNGTGIILPLDNSNTGARMLELLLNLEADILEYLKTGSSTAIDVSKGKFKGLPKFDDIDLLKNFERELRWLLVRTIKTTSDWDGYTEAVKKRKLKEYLDLRDISIKLLYGIGNSDDYSTTLPTDADILKLRGAYGKIINILGINNQTLTWTRGGALQVTGKPISTKVMLSLALFFSERVQGSSEWKLSSKKSRFLTKLSNVISYYRNERAIDKNNFTHGIFYTPIYNPGEKGSSRTAEKMCYPALDIPNTYVVDVDAQSPDMILDGDAYLAIVQATSGVATVQRLQPQQRTLSLLRTQPLRRTAQLRTWLGGTQQGALLSGATLPLGGTQETGDLPDGTKTSDWKEYAKQWLEYYTKQVFGETPLTLDLQSVIANNSFHSKAEAETTVNNLISTEIQGRINLFNVNNLPEDLLLTWNKVDHKNVYKPIKEFIILDFMNQHPLADISEFKFIPDSNNSVMLHGEFIADGVKYKFISDGFDGHLFTEVAPEATQVQPWSTDELKTLANDLKSYAESHVADNPAYLPILYTLTNLIENYAILSDDEIAGFGIMLQLIMDADDDFKSKFEELITEEKDCLNKLVAMFKQLSMM